MQPFSRSATAAGKSLTFTTAMSFAEFVAQTELYGDVLTQRRREVRLPAEQQFELVRYADTLHCIVLVSPDDPDTVAVLPILVAIADAAPRIDLRILTDEDDLSQLDAMVDDLDIVADLDDLDLPLLLIFDEEWEFQDQWGPRPAAADAYVDEWLENNPDYERLADDESDEGQDEYARLLRELTYQMRVWYNSGLDQECCEEIRQLFNSLQSDDEDDESDDGADSDEGDSDQRSRDARR